MATAICAIFVRMDGADRDTSQVPDPQAIGSRQGLERSARVVGNGAGMLDNRTPRTGNAGGEPMDNQACEWPDGCNREGFREVDATAIGHPGKRWLCLTHAGRVWNARKRANRAAGLCPCGSAVTPGFRTCARCREQGRIDRQRSRNLVKLAAECGIVLPREPERRRAFLVARSTAFRAASRERDRRWRVMRHRAGTTIRGWFVYAAGGEIVCSAVTSWEGHPVSATSRLTWGPASQARAEAC